MISLQPLFLKEVIPLCPTCFTGVPRRASVTVAKIGNLTQPQQTDLKDQRFCIENRSFDTGPSIIPLIITDPDFRHATEAGTKTTGHRSLQRQPAGNSRLRCNPADRFHHRFRPTTENR